MVSKLSQRADSLSNSMILVMRSSARWTLSFEYFAASFIAVWSSRIEFSSCGFSLESTLVKSTSQFWTRLSTFAFSDSSSEAACLSWPRISFAVWISVPSESQFWSDSCSALTRAKQTSTSQWMSPTSQIQDSSCSYLIRASALIFCHSSLTSFNLSCNAPLSSSHLLLTWSPSPSNKRICSSSSWHFLTCCLCFSSWTFELSLSAEYWQPSTEKFFNSSKATWQRSEQW